MGTIHEFPQWRAHRSQGEAGGDLGSDAQVVIFPGVRIEREESAGKPVVEASPVTSDGGRQTR